MMSLRHKHYINFQCILSIWQYILTITNKMNNYRIFRLEMPFKKTLLPLPCKECSKSFSESGSLKIHLTLIQEKSHLLLNNFPNHFHKRKSVMPFKDSKNSNLISTLSLLHHFCHCPLLSSNMSLSMFWLLRRWFTTILQRIFEMRKEKLLSCQSHFQIVLSRQLVWQS